MVYSFLLSYSFVLFIGVVVTTGTPPVTTATPPVTAANNFERGVTDLKSDLSKGLEGVKSELKG